MPNSQAPNLHQARRYIRQIKRELGPASPRYHALLNLLRVHGSSTASTPRELIERIRDLLRGHETLLAGLQRYLPHGYDDDDLLLPSRGRHAPHVHLSWVDPPKPIDHESISEEIHISFTKCKFCNGDRNAIAIQNNEPILLCEWKGCNREYHLHCLPPNLESDLIEYIDNEPIKTVIQEGTIPPGEIYCKECVTDGSSSVLQQYFARCQEMRKHYDSSRDYVLSLLERHMTDHPAGNTVDSEGDVVDLSEYEGEVGLKLPPRSELWYVEEMNEMAKTNPFDDGGMGNSISDRSEEKDAWSVADFLIGKPVRLYCNLDNEYHNGRIIDWRTCAVYANDTMPTPCKSKRKSVPISKLDYYGSGPISSCEFLVRFPAGEGRRQKEILQWILLEEHSLAVGITLVRARFDIKSHSPDKWRPAMVLARSALELVPVREFLQEGVNGELFGQKKLEEAEKGISSADDLLALTSFFGGKDHEVLNLNNEAKGLITGELLEKYNVDKELAGEGLEKDNNNAVSPTGVTGTSEQDTATSGKRRLSIPVPPKMALALAEYKDEYQCKEEYKILSKNYSDLGVSKPADKRSPEVTEHGMEEKPVYSLIDHEVDPSSYYKPCAALSPVDDDMMDASLTKTKKKHDNGTENQGSDAETTISEAEQQPENMIANTENLFTSTTDIAEADKDCRIEHDDASFSFGQAGVERKIEPDDVFMPEQSIIIASTVVSPNKMKNGPEEGGDAKKCNNVPRLSIDIEEEYDEDIYADYDVIEVHEDDESTSDDAMSIDSGEESIESFSRRNTFSQNGDFHYIQSDRSGRNRYNNVARSSERGQNGYAVYHRRRPSDDSGHRRRSRRMSDASEPKTASGFQEKGESRKRHPPQSREQPEAKKTSPNMPATKTKPVSKPASKQAPKKPAPKPAESSSDEEDANAKNSSGLAILPRGITMRPSGKWQAQLYYAGKSRYLGVFKNKRHALTAYDVAREYLMHDDAAVNATESSDVNLHISHARKLAKEALEK